jgi:hypothetical protein
MSADFKDPRTKGVALMALIGDTATPAQREKPAPALKLNFLSHGTLESRDLAFSRRFYEEFLGLEVVQTSPISLLIRLGGPNTIAVVYSKCLEWYCLSQRRRR